MTFVELHQKCPKHLGQKMLADVFQFCRLLQKFLRFLADVLSTGPSQMSARLSPLIVDIGRCWLMFPATMPTLCTEIFLRTTNRHVNQQ